MTDAPLADKDLPEVDAWIPLIVLFAEALPTLAAGSTKKTGVNRETTDDD